MVQMFIAAIGILALSQLSGRAILRLSRYPEDSPLGPVFGFSLLVIVTAGLITAPGHATTAVVGLLLVAAVSVFICRPKWDWTLVAPLLVGVCGASIPFLAAGRFGILGVSIDDDLASHLVWTDMLATGRSLSHLVPSSYPIGAHALAATLARLLDLSADRSLMGIMVAVPGLTAATACLMFQDLRPTLRVLPALLVGLPYLCAAYLAQGSFKETMYALSLLAFALTLREARKAERDRLFRLIPLLVVVPAAVLIRGWPGFVWFALAGFALAVGARLRARRQFKERSKGPDALKVAVGLAVLIVPLLPHVGRIADFRPALTATEGNLSGELSPFEMLGIWFSHDYRLPPESGFGTMAWQGLMLVVALSAGLWWIRRRDFEVPIVAGASVVIYLGSLSVSTAYFTAKVLAIAAPIVMLMMLHPLFVPAGRRRARPWQRTIALVVCAAGLWSSFLALRGAYVGPTARADELAGIRKLIRGQPTVFLPADTFGHWKIRTAKVGLVYGTRLVPLVEFPDRENKPPITDLVPDFDSIDSPTLDRFRYAVTTRSAFASEPPPNWQRIRETRSYWLWERRGPTPARHNLPELAGPGATFDCKDPTGATVARLSGHALVRAEPVVGTGWTFLNASGQPPAERIGVRLTETATQSLDLPPGLWEVSLQYFSSVPLELRASGLRTSLPSSLDLVGPYWSAGTFASAGGPVTFEVHAKDGFGFSPTRRIVLGSLAANKIDAPSATVPLKSACGGYVDWYEIDSSAPAG